MKILLSLILSVTLSTATFMSSLYAADTVQKIHHYTLSAPASAKVGEAITISVEAKDQADKVITDYRGSIFFQSSTDFGAILPAQGRSVTFKESDSGVIKLSNSVTLKRVGPQTLTVTDAQEDADGSVTINIEAGETQVVQGTGETMEIITPENNSSITSDNVTVSGKTKKNSKVNINLNGNLVGTVLSNESGLFTKNISGINQKSNILEISVLDGANTVVGSAQSKFELAGSAPNFLGLTITPTVVEAGSGVNFTVEADAGIPTSKIFLDNSMITGTEKSPGKYSFDIMAPAKPGTYPVQVILTNSLDQTTTKDNAGILTVTEKPVAVVIQPPVFKNLKASTEGNRVKFNFMVENMSSDIAKFKIIYGADSSNLSEEVITNSVNSIRSIDGTYNWYIDSLTPKTYSFKVLGVKMDGSVDQNLTSEVVTATIGGSPQCSIANVGDISVETTADKSILSWESLSGATSYNLYKVTPAGEYEMVQNLKENKYVLFLSSGSVAYENFAIKALCDDKTESPKASKVTKVQTGPGVIALLVILSGIFGVYIMRRRFI